MVTSKMLQQHLPAGGVLWYKLLNWHWLHDLLKAPDDPPVAVPTVSHLYPVVSGTPLFFQMTWGLGFPATWHWKTTLPPSTRRWALGLLTKEGGAASPPLVTSTAAATATLQEDHAPPHCQCHTSTESELCCCCYSPFLLDHLHLFRHFFSALDFLWNYSLRIKNFIGLCWCWKSVGALGENIQLIKTISQQRKIHNILFYIIR